jgi:hypothetical protein
VEVFVVANCLVDDPEVAILALAVPNHIIVSEAYGAAAGIASPCTDL